MIAARYARSMLHAACVFSTVDGDFSVPMVGDIRMLFGGMPVWSPSPLIGEL